MRHEGDMACPKCDGNKKIIEMREWHGEPYGVIVNCDECHGTGYVSDPDW